MNHFIISGIQQVGIGVSNVQDAWKWYREHFGMDIRIFEEDAVAALMLPYTGGLPQKRFAALAMNMQGGGGFEIWQYTNRVPQPPTFKLQIGDIGIFAAKIKCHDVKKTWELFKLKSLNISSLFNDPAGNECFFVTDPYNNIFQLVGSNDWFMKDNKPTGAAYGAIIGVTNIDNARKVYSDILGFDKILYDKTEVFVDFTQLSGGDKKFRRVLLGQSKPRKGSFSRLLGSGQIELLQVLDRNPDKIFKNRFWGDLGFIHLCFDISGMNKLRKECDFRGFPFTVDSNKGNGGNSFDMGEAAGDFSYIEDPDGTLIEFVETHKIPVIRKIGWYLNLQKRNPEKPLPDWILKSLRFNRVK
jgi:catechol 2,3-dioxygenase-like lactoylglutathione lyase family enzyme